MPTFPFLTPRSPLVPTAHPMASDTQPGPPMSVGPCLACSPLPYTALCRTERPTPGRGPSMATLVQLDPSHASQMPLHDRGFPKITSCPPPEEEAVASTFPPPPSMAAGQEAQSLGDSRPRQTLREKTLAPLPHTIHENLLKGHQSLPGEKGKLERC